MKPIVTGSSKAASAAELAMARILALSSTVSGITVPERSRAMVIGRITRRMVSLRMDAERYFHLVRNPGQEQTRLLDLICINHTYWWRESAHFDDLQERVLPEIAASARGQTATARFWSAGVASGDEAYSIALCLVKAQALLAGCDCRILGTDLSTKALDAAQLGHYSDQAVAQLAPADQALALSVEGTAFGRTWMVRDELKRYVQFARLNLIDAWPMHGLFDVIFCRNVLIYFDLPTRRIVLSNLLARLKRPGTLYLGHADAFPHAGLGLKNVATGIYSV